MVELLPAFVIASLAVILHLAVARRRPPEIGVAGFDPHQSPHTRTVARELPRGGTGTTEVPRTETGPNTDSGSVGHRIDTSPAAAGSIDTSHAAPGSIGPFRAGSRLALWLCALGLTFGSILVTECGVFCGNHSIQVPLIRLLNTPGLYPGDPFAASLARYPSLLWPLVAWLTRFAPLEGLLLTLFVLERLLVLSAAALLARTFAPRSWLAPVAAMGLFGFAINSILGGGTLVEFYFEQTGVAMIFILLAAAAFHRETPFAWALWLAASFAVNGMYGIFAMSFFAAAAALEPAIRKRWRAWCLAGFGLAAVVTVLFVRGFAVLERPASDDALWLAASRLRGRLHLDLLEWGQTPFLRFALFLGILLFTLFSSRRAFPRLFRSGLVWCACALLWLALAFLARYALHSPSLLMLQPARATDILVALGATTIVSLCAARIDVSTGSGDGRVALLSLGALFLLWRPEGSWVAAVVLIVFAAPLLWRTILSSGAPLKLSFLVTFWIFVVGVTGFSERYRDTGSLREAFVHGPEPQVRAVATWARAFTPRDAVFLVSVGYDPDWDDFRGLSERSIFTSWEEGTAIDWDRSFVRPWADRLGALGFDVTRRAEQAPEYELDEIFRSLTDDGVEALAKRYRIDFWVVPEDKESRFPVAFRTPEAKVLRVR